jgi:hypothetical protein
MSNLMNILKAKHHPEQFALDQAAAELNHKENLAFVSGAKAVIEAEQISKALFISDDSALGFKPNK